MEKKARNNALVLRPGEITVDITLGATHDVHDSKSFVNRLNKFPESVRRHFIFKSVHATYLRACLLITRRIRMESSLPEANMQFKRDENELVLHIIRVKSTCFHPHARSNGNFS